MYFDVFKLLPLVANPNTGDPNRSLVGIMLIVMLVAALILVGYLVFSVKKKNKKKKK